MMVLVKRHRFVRVVEFLEDAVYEREIEYSLEERVYCEA